MTAIATVPPSPASSPLPSWLPPSGENKFQKIKAERSIVEGQGIKVLRLSIGQPTGPALLSAREAASAACMDSSESMHEYQDNGTPGVPEFAKRFALAHVPSLAGANGSVAYLPIPGIKPMLPFVPHACGAAERRIAVATLTDPGYDTPAVWCKKHPNISHQHITLSSANGFLFDPEKVCMEMLKPGDLLMVNYPHNPSGKAATPEWWREVCELCMLRGIRLFNDAAYAILMHRPGLSTLSEIAVEFPDLSWIEAFSASKAGNFTGWRVGAMAGSPDFIADMAKIKANVDSGLVAPMAMGVIQAFEQDRHGIESVRKIYAERIGVLIDVFEGAGMRLAVQPDAGFFTLWMSPKRAFGQEVTNADHFHQLLLGEMARRFPDRKIGLEGVPFDPYYRCAVTGHIHKMRAEIEEIMDAADPAY